MNNLLYYKDYLNEFEDNMVNGKWICIYIALF